MNKLTFTFYTTWILVILLSIFPVQSMENVTQLTLETKENSSATCPLPDFKLEDGLIFMCCKIQEVSLRPSIHASKEALECSIKNFMKMKTTCKKYYEALTFEKIGNFCKCHPRFVMEQIFHGSMPLRFDALFTTNNSSDDLILYENYHLYRPLILILIPAINDKEDKKLIETSKKWFKKAIYYNDACMVETMLKYHMIDSNEKNKDANPFFFDAKIAETYPDYTDLNMLRDLINQNTTDTGNAINNNSDNHEPTQQKK